MLRVSGTTELFVLQLRRAGSESKREAVFHTAGVWLWNSDLETSNFVPDGEVPGPNVRGKA